MEVLFCFDTRYEQHFGVAVTSLLINNPGQVSKVHIITDRASQSLQSKLDRLQKNHAVPFCTYEIDGKQFSSFKLSAHFSIAAYFRLLAAEVLPSDLDRVLYLDSDLVVTSSLAELWSLDISEYPIAAWGHRVVTNKKRLELQNDYYFNSGVMLINLAAWRRDQIPTQAMQFVNEHPEMIRFVDQDALNKIIDGDFLQLPEKWNSLVDLSTERSQFGEDAAIVHFVGSLKPWQIWCLNPDKAIYWKYLKQSPWSNAFPTLPQNSKQALSAGRYVWNYVRRGGLKPKVAN
ncbi:glycosyltransferase family 8 protein [Leptolyngbya sp. AN03gr2]